ncbi:hypothetical protein LZC95_21145 [Pendulispora brunnea]|uniref:Uncharacterized protein n=1 Tax=Pendulispora brunnea TaxID=2905690 RepID=A0ABZ2KLB8_9BACT
MPLIIGELIARIEVTPPAARPNTSENATAEAEEQRQRTRAALRLERERRFDLESRDHEEY